MICEEEIDLNDIDFDYDKITVVLRGFWLDATSYEAGYNARGFTIRLIPLEKSNGVYRFNAKFQIHPGHSPDRPLLDDQCWKGDHCTEYTYKARIYYTLIGMNREDGTIKQNNTATLKQTVSMSPYKVPNLVEVNASIQGEANFDDAFLALQGISWHLTDWDSTKKDGRYLREIRFNVGSFDYNPNTGKASYVAKMYFHNSGAWPYGYEVSYKMWSALIQVNDPSLELSDEEWFEGNIASGGEEYSEEVSYEF